MNRLKDTYKHMAAVASALLLALSVRRRGRPRRGGREAVYLDHRIEHFLELCAGDEGRPSRMGGRGGRVRTQDREMLGSAVQYRGHLRGIGEYE